MTSEPSARPLYVTLAMTILVALGLVILIVVPRTGPEPDRGAPAMLLDEPPAK